MPCFAELGITIGSRELLLSQIGLGKVVNLCSGLASTRFTKVSTLRGKLPEILCSPLSLTAIFEYLNLLTA